MRSSLLALAGSLSLAALAGPVAAADAAKTHRVRLVPFKIESRLEGVLEPAELSRIAVRPKRWSQLVVEQAAAHGTRVAKGDTIITIETRRLDEAIRDLEFGRRIGELAHRLVELEVARAEKDAPLQLEIAERASRMATEDLQRLEKTEAKLAGEANAFSLKSSRFALASAEEELEQLEKMYKQDDLTEETEEIVLKRARFQAEASRFFAKLAADRHDRNLQLELPRVLEQRRTTARFAEIDLERVRDATPVSAAKLRLELERSADEHRKTGRQLADLKADRALLPVTAPSAGVVYHGRFDHGKWIGAEEAGAKLRTGAQLQPHDAVMTVLGPGALSVVAVLPEKELARVAAGAAAVVVPKAFPELRLAGRVRVVSAVPVSSGRFQTRVELDEEHPRLVAGMEAEVRVTAVARADALAVPRKAVFTDELDDSQRYVFIAGGEGREPTRRTVAVGRSNDELVEIAAGLAVDEELLLEKPVAEPGRAAAAAAPTPAAESKPAAPGAADGDAAKGREPAPAATGK